MPFGYMEERPFRANRLFDFDDPTMLGTAGYGRGGRGGRGGSRGHMRGRQGRFQNNRQYIAHNNRRLATNMLGRVNSTNTNQNEAEKQNLTSQIDSGCGYVTLSTDMNGNAMRICKNPRCQGTHGKDGVLFQPATLAAATPPPEYQSSPSSPMCSRPTAPPLTQTNNLKPSTEEHEDHFGKLYGCKAMTNIIVMVLAVIFFAIFLTLLILLA